MCIHTQRIHTCWCRTYYVKSENRCSRAEPSGAECPRDEGQAYKTEPVSEDCPFHKLLQELELISAEIPNPGYTHTEPGALKRANTYAIPQRHSEPLEDPKRIRLKDAGFRRANTCTEMREPQPTFEEWLESQGKSARRSMEFRARRSDPPQGLGLIFEEPRAIQDKETRRSVVVDSKSPFVDEEENGEDDDDDEVGLIEVLDPQRARRSDPFEDPPKLVAEPEGLGEGVEEEDGQWVDDVYSDSDYGDKDDEDDDHEFVLAESGYGLKRGEAWI